MWRYAFLRCDPCWLAAAAASLREPAYTKMGIGVGYTNKTSAGPRRRREQLMRPSFTLGIEEEYQTVDPETRDLRSHINAEIIEKGKLLLQERVKAEMHQSVIEVGTSVCANIKDAKEELKKLRRDMIKLSRENGLRLASAATHPFADWRVQEVYPDERYKNIVQD